MANKATYFLTGYPGFIGKRLARQIAAAEPRAQLRLLVEEKRIKDAELELKALGPKRVELLAGDVAAMHLGLAGAEYRHLCDEATHIFHLAAATDPSSPRERAFRINVEGTRTALELAHDCRKLERFNHFSTASVSGDRVGIIAEDELEEGQGFRNAYEDSKFQGERLVRRAAATLPVTIYRPCSVVGDSGTGEVDRFDGPYALALWVSMSGGALPLPFLGEGGAPLNVVPVDFVIQAVWQLSRDPRALGRTLHLVDPNPMSTRRAYELVAEKLNRRVPRFRIPTGAANAVLRLPFWERVAGPQRVALRAVNHMAVYNCNNVLELLDGTGIRCPPLPSYLDALVAFVREVYRRPKEVGPEADAPPRVADPRSLPRRPRSHAQ